ncbi:MAG: hypothetical protein HY514_01050 [Candidatus Aenigmarchaeota archaeon]|nr:hypothetical protein [Candidatus Aenigmarchaeota archaeon]
MEEFDIEIEIIDTLGVCKIINGEPRILEPHKSSKIKKKYPDGLPDFY